MGLQCVQCHGTRELTKGNHIEGHQGIGVHIHSISSPIPQWWCDHFIVSHQLLTWNILCTKCDMHWGIGEGLDKL